MIEQQVAKLSELYHVALAKQGKDAVMQTMQQAADEFMVSTNNELQNELDDLTFDESAILGKMVAGYAYTLQTLKSIERESVERAEITKSLMHIVASYKHYENKYNEELEYRNQQERENYINSILLPLMMLIDFLKIQ